MASADEIRLSEVLTVQQAAQVMGLTPDGVYRAIKAGRLQAQRLGAMLLLERAEVESYKAARERIWGRRAV